MASGTQASHRRTNRQWWFLLTAAPVALVLGTVGYLTYQSEHLHQPAHVLSALYQAAQLFVLNAPQLEHPVHWTLEAGRWLAAACFGLAVLLTLHRFFRTEWRRFRTSLAGPHVVVCGLGELGLRLAIEYRQAGRRVTSIEVAANALAIETAHDRGIAVVVGDARDSQVLRESRVARADSLIAVCEDDATNIGVASAVGRELAHAAGRKRPLECWLFVANPQLRATLREGDVFPHASPNYRVNVRGLDLTELHARLLFQQQPLDYAPIAPDSAVRVHLVVAGFGQMGCSLALQAARIGHFANSRRLRLTIVDRDAASRLVAFKRCYPRLRKVCQVEALEAPADEGELSRFLAGLRVGGDELVTYAVCFESPAPPLHARDELNLSVGLSLGRSLRDTDAQIHIFLSNTDGAAALLPHDGRHPTCSRLHAFGMIEDICCLSTLLHEEQDQLAQALHEAHLAHEKYDEQGKERADFGTKPGHGPWEALPESLKEANRQAADHVPVKLRALGYHLVPRELAISPITAFSREQIRLLAPVEHARWCASRWLDGWRYSRSRDDARRLHHDLIPWEKLPEKERHIDVCLATDVPQAIAKVGKAICR